MKTKYVFVTGGVVSSLGKGISASCLGMMLAKRGLKVFMMKFDPYLNVDPGTMSPYQHGEVFVTDDGCETDLDLGHYERFTDIPLTKESSITSGKIYQTVLDKERRGDYLGSTVQVIPHVTNEIKKRLLDAAEASKADIIIAEIGGTVGDIESLPFIEAIRQARAEMGYENTLFIHNTLVPYLKTSGETKTKPTQHSVKELLSLGIQPDIIILRSEVPIDLKTREKISLFCNVNVKNVLVAQDQKIIYNIALTLHEQHLDDLALEHFHLGTVEADLSAWKKLCSDMEKYQDEIELALVGKYVELHDAYLSVKESLVYSACANKRKIKIRWVDATNINSCNVDEVLKGVNGILVPGGFGERGVEGKKTAIKYARENKIPFLGICLGMQLAVIEYANNVLNLTGANSTELDPTTKYPVIDYLPDQYKGISLGGTMRLGSYACKLKKGSLAYKCYNEEVIHERHRHRYEFNPSFKELLSDGNFTISGVNPETNLAEIIELKDHPFFIASQFHPEFKSRPLKPSPLFNGFIKAAINCEKEN